MIITLLAAAAALLDPTPFTRQAAPTAAGPAPLQVDIPELHGAAADPTCGGRTALAGQAFCVATTQAAAEGLMNAYTTAFERQGWLAAGGRENMVVFVKRKDGGGCDGFQVLVFTPDNAVASPAGPASFAFAAIPGDVCHSQAPAAQ